MLFQDSQNEFFFRAKMVIERHFGDPGLGQNPINTGGVITVSVKQHSRRLQQLVAFGAHRN